MKKLLTKRKITLGILLLFAVLNVFRLTKFNSQNNRGIDLRTVYLGSILWQKNANPYNDSLLKAEWRLSMPDEVLGKKITPGLPSIPLLYPPTALVLVASMSRISWPLAITVFTFLEIVCIFFVLWFTLKITEKYNISQGLFFASIALLSFKAVLPSVYVCQPTWPVLALLLGAWYFVIQQKITLAGILIGLAFSKFTLAIPVFIFLFSITGKMRWKLGLTAFLVQLTLMAVYFVHTDWVHIHSHLLSWTQIAAQYRNYIFDPNRPDYPFTYELTSITETGVLFPAARLILYAIILLVSLLIGALHRKKIQNNIPEFYLLCSATMLCVSHHLYYDILLFFPGLFFIQKLHGIQKYIAAIALLCFLLPFTAIVNQLGNPLPLQWLQYSNAMGCLILLLLVWYRFVFVLSDK